MRSSMVGISICKKTSQHLSWQKKDVLNVLTKQIHKQTSTLLWELLLKQKKENSQQNTYTHMARN